MVTVTFQIKNVRSKPTTITIKNAESINDAWHQLIDSNWVELFYLEQVKVIDVIS